MNRYVLFVTINRPGILASTYTVDCADLHHLEMVAAGHVAAGATVKAELHTPNEHNVGRFDTQSLFADNLDGCTPLELDRLATLHNGTAYGSYAACKRRAFGLRLDGKINMAMGEEKNCEALYQALPAWQRW